MRVPLSWLRELVPVDLSPEALAERLTLLGMEVRDIERIGADWRNVVVGELTEVARHPGSSRLSLTKVRAATDGPELSIVCGATNIAVGQHVPVALPGAELPGGRSIEVAKLAGVESQGMLCSGAELGLSNDADGILILPSHSAIGTPLEDLVGDVVLDIDVKPNRGDALSMVGLAREVSAATGQAVTMPDIVVGGSGDATSDHLAVEVEAPELCSRFVGRYLDGIAVGPSPFAVQRRLLAAGVRPISNVVDASNYVMLELGKPIHTFDADAIHDATIVVRTARPGERIETLDHVERVLDADVLLIADPAGALGIAGVMGGATSEVSDDTTRVVVESAVFDPVSIRRTAFRYALRSEASLRFEKGQEHRLARIGADRTAQLILAWAGGRAATGVVDSAPVDPPLARVPFRPGRVSRLLGVPIPTTEQTALLERVGVATVPATADDTVPLTADMSTAPLGAGAADALVAIVPSHRRDLAIEADIAEEVARVRGYETLPGSLPDTAMPGYRDESRRATDRIRELLAGHGLTEVVTHGLIGPLDHARIGCAAHDPGTIRATNPVTVDHSEMRRSLVPGLLHVLADNERQRRHDVALFEVGPVHERRSDGPHEIPGIGLLLAGAARPPTHASRPRPFDVADVKGVLEALAARLGHARLRYEAIPARPFLDHPGRTAAVIAELPDDGDLWLGRVGELHPSLVAAFDARAEHVVFAELELDAVARLATVRTQVGELERLPAVERDLAVVVRFDQPAGEVGSVILANGGPRLDDVRLFDRYQGPPLAADEVSLAWRLRFEPGGQPLDDPELDGHMERVVGALSERFGGRLRV